MQLNQDMFKVDKHSLREILRDRELKYWWVAEQAGIHKTTLRRWLSGRVQRAHESKISPLASILNTELSKLTLRE